MLQDELKREIGPAYGVLKAIAILIAVYVISALVFGFFPFSVARGVVREVVNEKQIIQNYQWFYDQYNQIQAQRANYSSVPESSYERTGMRNVLNNSIAEYNSRSRQITRNLWKANDLPYQLELVGGL